MKDYNLYVYVFIDLFLLTFVDDLPVVITHHSTPVFMPFLIVMFYILNTEHVSSG